MNDELEGSGRGLIKTLSRIHLPGGSEEAHENPQSA
jgi:hypothetical protein